MKFQVPTNEEAHETGEDKHGEDTWRNRVLHFLHSQNVQRAIMVLLFLDIIILVVEIFLVGYFPPCNVIERDCIACCPSQKSGERFLASSSNYESVCEAGFDRYSGHGACDGAKYHTVHIVEEVLFWCTISILAIFCLEIHAEAIALGATAFFSEFFYLFDYVIVVVSITLELIFHFDSKLGLSSMVGLIIFARLWRFVRIGHAIVEISSEVTHQSYDELLEYTEKLEMKLKEHQLSLPECPRSVEEKRSEGKPSHHKI